MNGMLIIVPIPTPINTDGVVFEIDMHIVLSFLIAINIAAIIAFVISLVILKLNHIRIDKESIFDICSYTYVAGMTIVAALLSDGIFIMYLLVEGIRRILF